MQIEGELWEAVSRLVADSPVAILATADGNGAPHAVWMNTVVSPDFEEVIAITLPSTYKAANLLANPQAEWTFATSSRDTMVSISGPTEILSGEEALRCWNAMPGKSDVCYRKVAGGDSDNLSDYAVIRTKVRKVVHSRAFGYRKIILVDKDSPSPVS